MRHRSPSKLVALLAPELPTHEEIVEFVKGFDAAMGWDGSGLIFDDAVELVEAAIKTRDQEWRACFLKSSREKPLLGELMNAQLLSNATKGLVLGIVETLAATGQVFASAGPFQVDVTDPTADANGQNGAITVVPGTPDQKTPTIFRVSGNNKTGTIDVKVTDTSNGLTNSISFDVAAPPPPPPPAKADTLTLSLTPEA